MKLVTRFLALIVLAGSALFYSSCGPEDEPTKSETDTQLELLNGTWLVNAASVTLEGQDPPFDFTGFKLVINGTAGSTTFNWTAQSRPELSPWDSQGTFTFGSPVTSKLIRDDDVTITYSVTATGLVMDLADFTGPGYEGRVSSVEGDWHFEFTKQ